MSEEYRSTHEHFKIAIETLLLINRQQQRNNANARVYHRTDWLLNFATVRVSAGICVGKTAYAELKLSSPLERVRVLTGQMLKKNCYKKENAARILTPYDIHVGQRRLSDFFDARLIIIDEPRMTFEHGGGYIKSFEDLVQDFEFTDPDLQFLLLGGC